jgi:hypothetical protein
MSDGCQIFSAGIKRQSCNFSTKPSDLFSKFILDFEDNSSNQLLSKY